MTESNLNFEVVIMKRNEDFKSRGDGSLAGNQSFYLVRRRNLCCKKKSKKVGRTIKKQYAAVIRGLDKIECTLLIFAFFVRCNFKFALKQAKKESNCTISNIRHQ